MDNLTKQHQEPALEAALLDKKLQRRSFLKYAGASAAGVALIAAGCHKGNDSIDKSIPAAATVSFGSGDVGILNYAYALEQLEAAFYTQVVATPYSGISTAEKALLTDIRDHEIAHREFFKAAITAAAPTMIIGSLEVDFSSINFSDRASVLGTAKAFEDLGVSAYDGAGYLIKNANYLLLAGKIVSVEARHASLIRELLSPNTFLGDQVDANSVNIARTPLQVLAIAGTYIKTKIDPSSLPTS